MASQFVEVSKGILDLNAIVEMHQKAGRLWVRFDGGAVEGYSDADAEAIYKAVAARSTKLVAPENSGQSQE